MPKFSTLLLGGLLLITLDVYGATKTWIGSDGDNWNNAASWDPAGAPLATDDVVISGFSGTIVINSSSANTFVQSLNITNGSDVFFAGNTSGRRMTISCAGCSSGVESGSFATFTGISGTNACDLFFSQSPVLTVDGTLVFTGAGNSELFADKASITINGSLNFSGSGNSRLVCTGGVTAVNGEIVYSGGGATISANPTNLIINDNGIYEIAKNGTSVPNASWSNNATLKITGMTTDDPTFSNNAILGNLMWDCPGQVAPAVLNVNLTMSRVDVFDTGISEIQVSAQNGAGQMRTWIINDDYTQSGGIVNLSSGNNGSGKINFKGGNFYASQTLTESSTNGKGILEFSGTQPQTAYFGIIQNTVDVTIHGAEKVILNTQLTINAQSALNLVSGNLITSAQNLLTVSAGGIIVGGSLGSHVIGPVRKVGNTAFNFPIGKGTTFAPMAITAPAAVTDTFTAEYFDDPYSNTTSYLAPLVRVSQMEHWQLARKSGTGPVQVTLYWQNGSASGINDLPSLTVARFNGINWTNAGGTAGGSVTTGNVQSDTTSAFSWFTFGAKNLAFNPLPVELTSFDAVPGRNYVVLNWTTATEKNNAWFAIESSTDGRQFAEIGRIPGAGTSNTHREYTFIDEHPLPGVNYYRLRQIDDDGLFSFSPVRSARVSNTGRLLLYPAPATDLLRLQCAESLETTCQWYVFDASGRVVLAGSMDAGTQILEIQVGQLPDGTYVLSLVMGQEQLTERFVKQARRR